MTLYVATSNPGKLRDFAVAAAGAGRWQLEPLPGLSAIAPPEEDQPTFEGNARLKAVYYSRFAEAQSLVIADDSGLEVDTLGGAPGVHSARYATLGGFARGGSTDARNNQHLLTQLGASAERQARYRCVLVAARDGKVVATAEGVVEGEILLAPRGTLGFGYDPLFYLPSLGRTMAEIGPESRLTVSHRGRALRALLAVLEAEQADSARS